MATTRSFLNSTCMHIVGKMRRRKASLYTKTGFVLMKWSVLQRISVFRRELIETWSLASSCVCGVQWVRERVTSGMAFFTSCVHPYSCTTASTQVMYTPQYKRQKRPVVLVLPCLWDSTLYPILCTLPGSKNQLVIKIIIGSSPKWSVMDECWTVCHKSTAQV